MTSKPRTSRCKKLWPKCITASKDAKKNLKMAARKSSRNSYLQVSTFKTAYQVLLLAPLTRNPTKIFCHLESEMTHTHTHTKCQGPHNSFSDSCSSSVPVCHPQYGDFYPVLSRWLLYLHVFYFCILSRRSRGLSVCICYQFAPFDRKILLCVGLGAEWLCIQIMGKILFYDPGQ